MSLVKRFIEKKDEKTLIVNHTTNVYVNMDININISCDLGYEDYKRSKNMEDKVQGIEKWE